MEEDDDFEESSRKEKVANLINCIKKRRDGMKKKAVTVVPTQVHAKGTGSGRHIRYKVHIGWQNLVKGSFHLVTARTGGGIRSIEYKKDQPQNVKTLTELGKKLFFPDGESTIGNIDNFNFTLANYKGESINEFRDLDGNECSFQEYLKAHGMYSSQFHIYIRSSPKIDGVSKPCTPIMSTFMCNNKVPEKIDLKFAKLKQSVYSSNEISISCYAFKECFNLSGLPQDLEEEYNAIDDGFKVTSISIGGKCYLTKDTQYAFPEYQHIISNSTIILHGPSEINGYDYEKNLILGLITTKHNQSSAIYYWFKDGEQVISGVNQAIMTIKQPGAYQAGIEVDKVLYISGDPVIVTQSSFNTEKLSTVIVSPELKSMETRSIIDAGVVKTLNLSPDTSAFVQTPNICPGPSGVVHTPTVSPGTSGVISTPKLYPVSLGVVQTPNLGPGTSGLETTPNTCTGKSGVVQTPKLKPGTSAVLQTTNLNPANAGVLHTTNLNSDTADVLQTSNLRPSTSGVLQTQNLNPANEGVLHTTNLNSDPPDVLQTTILNPGTPCVVQTSNLYPGTSGFQTPTLSSGTSGVLQNTNLGPGTILQSSPLFMTQNLHTPEPKVYNSPELNLVDSTNLGFVQTQTTSEFMPMSLRLTNVYDKKTVVHELVSPELKSSEWRSMVDPGLVQTPSLSQDTSDVLQTTNVGPRTSTDRMYSTSVQVNKEDKTIYSSPFILTQNLQIPEPMFHNSPELNSVKSSDSVDLCLVKTPSCKKSESLNTKKRASNDEINIPIKKASLEDKNNNDYLCSVQRINFQDITIGNQIGEVVFKGEWISTPVAVKKITVKRMKIFEKNLERELQIHSRIRHPNIVQLMAYSTDKNSLYLVEEYIEGHNLEEIVFGKDNDCKGLDLASKCTIARGLLQAISYLHNIKPVVVHRDIKLENVLVSPDFKTVKLCDMGLSKLKTMTTLITTLAAKHAQQPGTPMYQAPELILDRQSATCQSDIFSLSCSLVELFTEDLVWNLESLSDEEDEIDLIKRMMKAKRRPDGLSRLMLLRDDIPTSVIDILTRGMSFDKDERPSALEMLEVFKST